MNTISTNESISKYITFNIKPLGNEIEYEDALHNTNKIRAIRDQSTDVFIKTMFSYDLLAIEQTDNDIKALRRNTFLIFVFDSFKLSIISDFNSYLIKNNCEILDDSCEFIDFLFKGGNIMFVNIMEQINKNKLFNFFKDKEQLAKLKSFLSESFAVSDFDFAVYIKCNNYDKSTKVRKYLTEFLIQKLEDINGFFNGYLLQALQVNESNSNKKLHKINKLENNYEFYVSDNNIEPSSGVNNNMDLNTMNTKLNSIQEKTIDKLLLVNTIFSNIYNNKYFDKLMSAIRNNANARYELTKIHNQEDRDSIIIHYAKIISTFEITKIYRVIDDIFFFINYINRKLQSIFFDEYSNNKYYNATFIKVLSNLTYINKLYSLDLFNIVQFNLDKIRKIQNIYFHNMKKYIRSKNFYNEKLFVDMIILLRTKLYNLSKPIDEKTNMSVPKAKKFVNLPNEHFLFKTKKDYQDESNYIVTKITNDKQTFEEFNINNILIASSSDTLVKSNINETPILIELKKPNNIHYISFNTSINTVRNNYLTVSNFDLIRTKFNFSLKNILKKKYKDDKPKNWYISNMKIPSEFIDISIPFYEESLGTHYLNTRDENKKSYELKLANTSFVVDSYNLKYLVYDLQTVLFSQNTFIPWADAKYMKRLKRMFFLYGIQTKNNTRFLKVINYIAKNMLNAIEAKTREDALKFIQLILPYSKFKDINTLYNDFMHTCDNIVHYHVFTSEWCDKSLYFRELDSMLNSLFYSFFIYIYSIGEVEPICFNITNFYRHNFNYYKYESWDEYYRLYASKILRFIKDIEESTRIIAIFLSPLSYLEN